MNGLHPYTFPELYSKLILGTEISPGKFTPSGHDRNEEWDNQKAKGTTGASSKLNGRSIGTFTGTFELSGDSDDEDGENDFTRWDKFQKLIESTTSGSKPVALACYHPDLCRNGFTEIVNAGVGGMVWDDKGGAKVTVKFQEYKPSKPKKTAKAKAKLEAPGKVDKPDPNAKAKAELAGLLAEAKK